MEDREFEQLLESVFSTDRSAGTEEFRDELLKQCLSILDSSDADSKQEARIAEGGYRRRLSDEELDMLAAAGDCEDVPISGGLEEGGLSVW